MKFQYCPNCKKAYVKSHLEKNKCIYCNQPCETVEVKRNKLYYSGNLVMIMGATLALVPRLTTLSGSTFFFVMGVVLLLGGIALVMMGSTRMAKTAAAEAASGMVEGSGENDSE